MKKGIKELTFDQLKIGQILVGSSGFKSSKIVELDDECELAFLENGFDASANGDGIFVILDEPTED